MKKPLEEALAELEVPVVRFDGLDKAIIGIGTIHAVGTYLVYSEDKIIECLMDQGMSYEEAWDFYGFNIQCLWAEPSAPVIVSEVSTDE